MSQELRSAEKSMESGVKAELEREVIPHWRRVMRGLGEIRRDWQEKDLARLAMGGTFKAA